ncbi:hypothetical protein C7B69_13735 [filamentous cyanobacterium Phorm 46]|nr:hypothetical protein C7B69_13735 [filamentous cyanobacterium Phorm 46]
MPIKFAPQLIYSLLQFKFFLPQVIWFLLPFKFFLPQVIWFLCLNIWSKLRNHTEYLQAMRMIKDLFE